MAWVEDATDAKPSRDGLADPRWAVDRRGKFHRLVHLDPEAEGLTGASGVFVVWHGGVRPRWVYVGRAQDLAGAFHRLGRDADVMDYEVNGGLFVTWSLIRTDYQDGVVRYLSDALSPAVENPDRPGTAVRPVPVSPPRHR
jgi:hypothetical protein